MTPNTASNFQLDIGFIEGLEKGVLKNLALNVIKTSKFTVFSKPEIVNASIVHSLDLTFTNSEDGCVYDELLILSQVEKFNFSLTRTPTTGFQTSKFSIPNATIRNIEHSEFNTEDTKASTLLVSIEYSL
jgi:hypothetical protein